MKSLSISEFKSQFSKLLKEVRQGETIEIVSDDERKPIARFEPIDGSKKDRKRKLGFLEGKANTL